MQVDTFLEVRLNKAKLEQHALLDEKELAVLDHILTGNVELQDGQLPLEHREKIDDLFDDDAEKTLMDQTDCQIFQYCDSFCDYEVYELHELLSFPFALY